MRACTILHRISSLLFVFLCCCALARADDLSQYWQQQETGLRAALATAAKQNVANPRALLGAALIATYEDSEVEAVAAWRAYFLADAGGWAADAYWPQFADLAQTTGKWSALEDAARAILAVKETPPDLRTSARLVLADALDRAGQFDEADNARTALGYLRNWRVIGPFDNVSHSGFAKPFPPETAIDFAKTYPGLDNRQMQWHDLAMISRTGECEIGTALGDESESVFYAVTAINSPQAQPVRLYLNPSGACVIYLNGRRVFADEQYRSTTTLVADPFSVDTAIQPGWNTVLVKVVSNDEFYASFQLRFTTPQGGDLAALAVDPTQARTQAAQVPPPGEPAPVEPDVAIRLRGHGESPELLAALGYRLRLAVDNEASAAALRKALAASPASGWLHWELSQTLSADNLPDEARTERDLARKANADVITAELDFLDEQEDALDAPDYLKQSQALADRHPGSPRAQWNLAYAYFNAEMEADGLKVAEKALPLANGTELTGMLIDMYNEYDRNADADKLREQALRADPCAEELLTAQAELLATRGQTAEAITRYQHLLQVCGPSSENSQRLAELYLALKDYARAEQTLRTLRRQCPQDVSACTKLADVLLEQKRTAEAIALYKEAIEIEPADVSLRSKVRLLAGEQPIVELAPATPVEPILAQAAKITAADGASAIVLLNEARVVVYADYASEAHIHQLIKVLDDAAAEGLQEMSLAVPTSSADVTIEKVRIIKADGKIQDVTDDAYGDSASFPSLASGDLIDITYRAEDYPRGSLARQFWSDWPFTVSRLPVKLSRFVLIAPPELNFRMQVHNDGPPMLVGDRGGWRVREWRLENVPAGIEEVGSPGTRDVETWLDISTIATWEQIVRWYRDLAGPRCVPDEAVRAKAAELTAGAKTEEEKIRALVAFVSHEIRYQSNPFRMSAFVPTLGKEVLRDRYGDCKDKASLLAALLATVGLKADLVLVNGRTDGIMPYLPSPRFEHVINRVHTANGLLWVDATADQMEYGALPAEDQGVWGLVIDDATADLALTPVVPSTTKTGEFEYELVLDEKNTLRGSMEYLTSGSAGGMLRGAIARVPDAQRDTVLRYLASQFLPGILYKGGSFRNLDDREQPLVMRFEFQADRYGAAAGNFLLVRLPWKLGGLGFENMITDAPRAHDLETSDLYGKQVCALRLKMPAGWTPQELAPEVAQQSPWGSYRITCRMEGDTLLATADLTITAVRISMKDYQPFSEFLRGFLLEGSKQVVFKK